MINSTSKLLDVVALTVDLPQYKLWHGQVGTIVEMLADGAAFEVEFSDRNGRTYESVGLRPEQIMVLRFEPASPISSMKWLQCNAAQQPFCSGRNEAIPKRKRIASFLSSDMMAFIYVYQSLRHN
ncbi:MAG TPA: hypothetical protein DCS91_00075 [Microcoleaceae bacterium UBA11344]|jgi:hypothetical protein|nr:hypothetical protein [Microcoleaceae cyanobacterium UBA11344]